MQAILVADYSFTPLEYWRHVSEPARDFIQRCLTIDPVARMTAHQALSHPWITGEPVTGEAGGDARGKADLLPTVKKNFNARRTLHAAIDTVRAINQLRASGAAGANASGNSGRAGGLAGVAAAVAKQGKAGKEGFMMPETETGEGLGKLAGAGDVEMGGMEMDPRGNARGQSEEQIKEQERRIRETQRGLWSQHR